ncbi:MAG: hypothetical protein WCL31_06515 [Actinomycetes bacterium]
MKRLIGLATACAVLGVSSLASAATAKDSKGDTYVPVKTLTGSTFSTQGPYAVGVDTVTVSVTVPDPSGATYSTKVDIWYPATKAGKTKATYNVGSWLPAFLQPLLTADAASRANAAKATYVTNAYSKAAAASGKFPLVLFSHGYSGFRDQSTALTTAIASWGYVVAAPETPIRNLTQVINQIASIPPVTTNTNADVYDLEAVIAAAKAKKFGLASTHVDALRVVAVGHSAGGSAVERLASFETSRNGSKSPLKGFIGLAGASIGAWSQSLAAPFNTIPQMPGLFVTGQLDNVVHATAIESAYGSLTGSRRLIELTHAGHQAFSDLCQINPGEGGLTALALALNISIPTNLAGLASDGCSSPAEPVTTSWRPTQQAVIAQIRYIFGADKKTTALTGIGAAFPASVGLNTTAPLP